MGGLGTALFLSVFLGIIPAAIAQSKGRNFFLWWLYGWALFIIALVHAILLKPDQKYADQRALGGGGMKKCPACAEIIRSEATVCRYCGRDVPNPTVSVVGPTATGIPPEDPTMRPFS